MIKTNMIENCGPFIRGSLIEENIFFQETVPEVILRSVHVDVVKAVKQSLQLVPGGEVPKGKDQLELPKYISFVQNLSYPLGG